MKILYKSQKNFEQRLNSRINDLLNPIIFDFTFESSTQQILTLSDSGIYSLSYSRPFFVNFFRLPLEDYKFVFVLEKGEMEESILITGKIKLKNYVLAGVSLFILITLSEVYDVFYNAKVFSFFSVIIIPSILILYLSFEYLFFRNRIKNILDQI